MDIEADEKVERNVGLEAGGVDAKQLEDLSLVVRVEEDEAVEEGEKEVEEDKDDQVVVDQLQDRTPKRHNHLHKFIFWASNNNIHSLHNVHRQFIFFDLSR